MLNPLNRCLFNSVELGHGPAKVGQVSGGFRALIQSGAQLLFHAGEFVAAGQQRLLDGLLTPAHFIRLSLTFRTLLPEHDQGLLMLDGFSLEFTQRCCCSHSLPRQFFDLVLQICVALIGFLHRLPGFLKPRPFIGDGAARDVQGGLAFPALGRELRKILLQSLIAGGQIHHMPRRPAASFFQIIEALLFELEIGLRLLGAHLQPRDVDRKLLLARFMPHYQTACLDNALLLAGHLINGLLQEVGELGTALFQQGRLCFQPLKLSGRRSHLRLHGLLVALPFAQLLLSLLQPALILQIACIDLLEPGLQHLTVSVQFAQLLVLTGLKTEEAVHLGSLLLMQP